MTAPEINPATQVTNKISVDAPLAAIPTARLVTEIIRHSPPVQLHEANPRVRYNVFQDGNEWRTMKPLFYYHHDYSKFKSCIDSRIESI